MGKFFKTLRRKFGVLTLVIACLFMGGWVRGFFLEDVWQPPTGKVNDKFHEDAVQHILRASHFGITWQRAEQMTEGKFGWQPGWGTCSVSVAAQIEEKIENRIVGGIKWRWRWCGFDFYESEIGDHRYSRRRIPYWAIVVPLTLLSAWLLLSTPRQSPLRKIAEPNPNEGTSIIGNRFQ